MLVYETKRDALYYSHRKILTTAPHLHHEVEFGIIVKGETVITVDGKDYVAKNGDVFFCAPNQIHSYTDKGSLEAYLMIINPNTLPNCKDMLKNYEFSPAVFPSQDFEFLKKLFFKALKIYDNQGDSNFENEAIISYTESIISELFRSNSGIVLRKKTDLDTTQRVLLYCDENYKDDLNLDILEKKLGYNKYYISHVFSDNVKMSFPNYIRYLRITAAKSMLRHSDKTITDIASECGYNSIRTFNRQFFSETGKTPKEYYISKRNQ